MRYEGRPRIPEAQPAKSPKVREDSDPYKDRAPITIAGLEPEDAEELRHQNRREFLNKAGLTALGFIGTPAAAALATSYLPETVQKVEEFIPPELGGKGTTEDRYEALAKRLTRTYEMGALTGHHISNHSLVGKYLGISEPGMLPETYAARPDLVLEKVWDEKILTTHSLEISGLGNHLIDSYRQKVALGQEGGMNLIEFTKMCESQIRTIERALDFEKVSILYQLKNDTVAHLESLASRITGQMLLAISTTEIMESGLNAGMDAVGYDAVLRNEGAEFVTRIPALGDDEPSFGPYQLTPGALQIGMELGADKKPRKNYTGASKMNRALPDQYKIPEEYQNRLHLHKLTSPEHHHAFAYLFALHNIATAMGTMEAASPRLIPHMAELSDETLLAFIASSHHKPTPSATALIHHLGHNRTKSFESFCPPDLQQYAARTSANAATQKGLRVA